MDDHRFDALAKRALLVPALPRRGALKAVAAGILTALGVVAGPGGTV